MSSDVPNTVSEKIFIAVEELQTKAKHVSEYDLWVGHKRVAMIMTKIV